MSGFIFLDKDSILWRFHALAVSHSSLDWCFRVIFMNPATEPGNQKPYTFLNASMPEHLPRFYNAVELGILTYLNALLLSLTLHLWNLVLAIQKTIGAALLCGLQVQKPLP